MRKFICLEACIANRGCLLLSQVVPLPWTPVWGQDVRCGCRHVGSGMHPGRITAAGNKFPFKETSMRYACWGNPWLTQQLCVSPWRQLPFLAGDSDLDQLTKIFEALGTPTEESWPVSFSSSSSNFFFFPTHDNYFKHWICLQELTSLPDYVSFKIFPGTPLEHIFSAAGDDLLELLQGLFTFNPLMRTTATQVNTTSSRQFLQH